MPKIKIKQIDWSKHQPPQYPPKQRSNPNENFWKKVVRKPIRREHFDRTEIIEKLTSEHLSTEIV